MKDGAYTFGGRRIRTIYGRVSVLVALALITPAISVQPSFSDVKTR